MLQFTVESVQYSFPTIKPEDFVFIALREHEEKFAISKRVEEILGSGFNISFLDEVTDGPVSTVLTLKNTLNPDEDFFTVDCDQYFRSSTLSTRIAEAQQKGWHGLIPTYTSDNPAYSYVKLDETGFATETAEKQVISNNAASGIYYFSSGRLFMDAAEEMVKNNLRTKNEFYMCPLYNILIKKGCKIKIVEVEKWMTLGTPEDAAHFIKEMTI